MKILHVNNQVRLGGAETVIRQLLRGFPEARLTVADGKSFPASVRPLYPRALARLYHSRLHRVIERLAPRGVWTDRAFRALGDAPFDLIHVHNFHGRYASIESLASVAQRKPLVWTFHALWGVTGGCDHPRDCQRFLSACGECPQLGRWPLGSEDDTATQLAAKLEHLAPLPLHIIAPSRWLAEIVRESRVGQHWRVSHVPNAVDGEFARALPAECPPRGERPTVLIVNRNFRDEQKGFPIVLAALLASTASRDAFHPRLMLLGENADGAAGQLDGWDCAAHGYVESTAALARWHAEADLFLFASPAENFPCAVLEAMAAGACVVATPTGGVTEQIEHGISGLLAHEISGPALSQVLAQALSDGPLRARLGRAAQKRASELYNETKFLERHRQLYAEVLASWHPPA